MQDNVNRATLTRILFALATSIHRLAFAAEPTQLDPFARATSGAPQCPVAHPRVYTPEEMRTEAHVRIERGARCGLEGTCEAGGAYKRDPEINEQVRAAIAGDKRFADTSIFLTTSRKWVTLKGCVRTRAQGAALAALVKRQPGVERVFDETTITR